MRKSPHRDTLHGGGGGGGGGGGEGGVNRGPFTNIDSWITFDHKYVDN